MKLSLGTIFLIALFALSLASSDGIAAKGSASGEQCLGECQFMNPSANDLYLMPIFHNMFILDLVDAQSFDDCLQIGIKCRQGIPDYNMSDPCERYDFCLAAEECNKEQSTCRCATVNDPNDEEAMKKCLEANNYDCGPRPQGC